MANATQCYTQSPRRTKGSHPRVREDGHLPPVVSTTPRAPEPGASVAPPSLAPVPSHPGTILLAPSRNGSNGLDLPMIDQICRSSFQVQKALQRWQRDALAAHRLQWDRQSRHRARCRAQVWRLRTQGVGQHTIERAESQRPEDAGELALDLPSSRNEESAGGTTREVRIIEPDKPGPGTTSSPTGAGGAAHASSTGKLSPHSPRMSRGGLPRRNEEVRMPRGKASPKAKPQRLRSLLKRRQEKRGERLEAAKKVTQALSPHDRDMLKGVFVLNSHTKEEVLHGVEVQRAAIEAGLVGHDAPERRAVAWACKPPAAWQEEGICFEEFAGKIIPASRQALIAARQEKMQKALASAPREWTGRIQRSRLFEAARLVLPIEFPETGEDLEDMAPESAALYEIVKTTSEGDGFSASAFAVELQKLSEEWYRRLALQRREIQRQMNLDEETFASAGTELPHLDEIFRRVSEGKGYLDRNEAEKLFDELGVVPHSLMQKRKTLGFLNEQRRYDFASFVKLVDRIRMLILSQEDQQLYSTFLRMAVESSKSVHAATRRAMRRLKMGTLAKCLDDAENGTEQQRYLEKELSEEATLQENEESEQLINYNQLVTFLTEAAALPEPNSSSTNRRRRLVGREVMPYVKAMATLERIMQDVDPASRQLFTYMEVRLVLQRLREFCRVEARNVEAKHIKDMGYSPEQVQELRSLFTKLDPHGTGGLSEVQVELALQSLGVPLPHEASPMVAFHIFDFDLSGTLDFLEFLHMIAMARRQEGPFKALDFPAAQSLSKLERCDLLLLLTVMHVPLTRVDGMTDARLIQEVAEMLNIGADQDLWPVIGGKTLYVLVRYAERR